MSAGLSGVRQSLRTEGFKTEHTVQSKALGMDVCFLLDISGSMSGAPSEEMVRQLLWLVFDSGMLDRDNDTVHIFVFNDSVSELLRPTFLKTLSKADLDALGIAKRCGGGTRLWTALNACLHSRAAFVRQKNEKDRAKIEAKGQVYDPARHVHKAWVLLVLTDGHSGDSTSSVMARLRSIAHEIPNFHMTLLGIGVDEGTARTMRAVADACGEAGTFTNVSVGAGRHASAAIADGFRTHFTHTVTRVRKVIRELSMRPDGHVQLKEIEKEMGSHGRATVRTTDVTAHIAALTLGEAASSRSRPAITAARAASPPPPPYREMATALQAKDGSLHSKPFKNGAACTFAAADKCTFFHPPSERPCRFGRKCRSLTDGQHCEFRHDAV